MAKDKRSHPRYEIHQAMTLEFGKERYIDCQGMNISSGGIQVTTSVDLALYDRLFIMFNLEDQETMIKTEVIVMHISKDKKQYRVGMEFAEMQPEDKRKLKRYLKKFES